MKSTGGILHFYKISEKPNSIEKTINLLKSKLEEKNWKVKKILIYILAGVTI